MKHKINMLKLKSDIEVKSSFSVSSDTNSTLTLKLIGKPERTQLLMPEIKQNWDEENQGFDTSESTIDARK